LAEGYTNAINKETISEQMHVNLRDLERFTCNCNRFCKQLRLSD